MEAGGRSGYPRRLLGSPFDAVAGRSANVRKDPAKGSGERVGIALLAEPAVVAREDRRLGPKSLRHGQRASAGERAF